MSVLFFQETANFSIGYLSLFALSKTSIVGAGEVGLQEIGIWQSHNNVAKSSNGIWPDGIYRFSHYNPHVRELQGLSSMQAMKTAYGPFGILVFAVRGRTGMGVHAGRSSDAILPGGLTMGCIRTSAVAMISIIHYHSIDPVSHLIVHHNRAVATAKMKALSK